MKLIGFFNRDGGTFKTTDMAAYEMKAEQVFRDAGHDFGSGGPSEAIEHVHDLAFPLGEQVRGAGRHVIFITPLRI